MLLTHENTFQYVRTPVLISSSLLSLWYSNRISSRLSSSVYFLLTGTLFSSISQNA